MTYRDELVALGGRTETIVVEIYRRFIAGLIDRDTTIQLIADIIAAANSRAVALADLALAAQLMADVQTPVATAGVVRPPGDPARLLKAASTVLITAEASDVPEAIVGRLARAEPIRASQTAFSEAIEKSGITKGWIRGISPGCCQLCRWWWRDGRVWPAAHPMPVHTGCTCTPIPVVRDGIKHTGYTRRMAELNMEEA